MARYFAPVEELCSQIAPTLILLLLLPTTASALYAPSSSLTWHSGSALRPLVYPATSSPSPRYDSGLAYDARDGLVLLFGGSTLSGFLNDTWGYSNGTWTRIAPAGAPAPRSAPDMVYDAADRYIVLFGGYTTNAYGAQVVFNDTWTYANGTWSRIHPAITPPVSSTFGVGSMAYDGADRCVYLLTGGSVGFWAFRAGSWSPALIATGSSVPSPRDRGTIAYDSWDGYLLMRDGNRTWTYSGGTWTNFTTGGPPRGAFGGEGNGMAFDRHDGYLLLFGAHFNRSSMKEVDQTWKYAGGNWTRLRIANPPGMWGARLTYDVKDRYILLFGGVYSTGPSSRTWTYSAGVWS